MKWRTIWRIGKLVVQVLDKSGVEIKGMPVGQVEAKVEELLTTPKTATEIAGGSDE